MNRSLDFIDEIKRILDHIPGQSGAIVNDRIRCHTIAVAVFRRNSPEYMVQYYDRISPYRLRRDTIIYRYRK